ncbi:MAG TPA: hypothetical protein VH165_10675 [Kofleriaceae bacterium]|jgi:hypothetical protein|nr:hypothetical protein [Kofleriaceae bacterium]
MRLTARGARLLDGSDDNPMLPGFLDRIKDRCHGLPESAIALLVDARACLDHSLMRPAVVLRPLGLRGPRIAGRETSMSNTRRSGVQHRVLSETEAIF